MANDKTIQISEGANIKAELGVDTSTIILPLPPTNTHDTKFEMAVYANFMRNLRHVPNSRTESKILAAIQFTADFLDCGDALIAKTLADLGLRASRDAFPVSFLDFADKAMQRRAWDYSTNIPVSIMAIRQHWEKIGEASYKTDLPLHYSIYGDGVYASA